MYTTITLRNGDDSNFNNHSITFNIKTTQDLTGWMATFQLQELLFTYDNISEKKINLVINREDSLKLQPGYCIGYLQLTDNEGRKGTVYWQEFLILPSGVQNE